MSHLTTEERISIECLLKQGKNQKEIAEKLGRDPATISRELKRNALGDGEYSAVFACRYAKERKENIGRKNAMTPEIMAIVDKGLNKRFSPEQIVGRAQRQEELIMPCTQTIYNFIHKDRKHHGKRYKKLRYHGKPRRKYGTGKLVKSKIPARRDISERPAIVDTRSRFGDFECDLIIGAGQSGAILSINERQSGLVILEKLPNKKAITVRNALLKDRKHPSEHLVNILAED